jgi:hypothetical protein
MGSQNGPQADADTMRHPRHSATAYRQSADETTANPLTTSHHWCGRTGRESHDCKQQQGQPQVAAPHPHTHVDDALRQLTMHISTNAYTAVNQHACCNWPRPEDAHATSARTNKRHHHHGLHWKTDGLPPAKGPPTTSPRQRHHSPSTPARGPPTPPTP